MSRLTFDEKTHRYKLDNKRIPGVTTVLGGGIPKGALPRWYARKVGEYVRDNFDALDPTDPAFVDKLVRAPELERDTAAERGTRIHANAEKLVKGEDVTITDDVDETNHVARFLDKWEIEGVLAERRVVLFDPACGGTFDLIARSPKINDGRPFMTDWKSSNNVYGDVALQLAPYSRADGYLGDDGELHPLPEITYNMVWHITRHGVNAHPVSINAAEIDQAFEWFKAAYTTYKNATARKNRLRPALQDFPAGFYDTLKGEAA